MKQETRPSGNETTEEKHQEPYKSKSVQEAVEKGDFTWIKGNISNFDDGVLPFSTALDMIMEKGGGYPDTVIKNLSKFSGVDGNELAAQLIEKGHPYSLINNWNDIPDLDKEKTLDLLINNNQNNIPTDKERLQKLAGEGNIGKFINKLQWMNFSKDFLKVVMDHAEPGSLNTEVAKSLIGAGYEYSANKHKDLFNLEAQKLIAASEVK